MSADPLDYITLDEWKTIAGWTTGDASVDGVVPTLITQASEALNEHLERQITPKDDGPTTHRIAVRGYVVDLEPYDLRVATQVVLNPEGSPRTLTVEDDYSLVIGPVTRDGVYTDLRLSQWTTFQATPHWMRYGYAQLDITGSWGYATIPQSLKRACAITVQSWMRQRRQGAYFSQDPREQMPQMVAVGELPYAAINLARSRKRHIGSF